MDQEKIGKFIATLRKEKGLTQQELAEKLGITKNAVSKWERGLGLMDMSLLKPLSEILDVSVTEILNGERFLKEEINNQSEKVLISTLDYSSKEIKKVKKRKWLTITLTIIITIISIIFFFTFQAIVFKNSPIISFREELLDDDSYVDRGILIDTYYCIQEGDIETVIPTFKNTNYNCPLE